MYVNMRQSVQLTKTAPHDKGQTHTFVREGASSMTIVFNTGTVIRTPGPGGGAPRHQDWLTGRYL